MADFPNGRTFPLTPDGFVEIVFTPDRLDCLEARHWKVLPRVFVVGRLQRALTVRLTGPCRFLAIRLLGATAAIVLRSFGLNANGVSPASGVFDDLEKTILKALRAGELEKLRSHLEAQMIIQRNRWNPILPQVRTAVNQARHIREAAVKDGNARKYELSRRQEERHIREASGTNARTLSRIGRFERARDLMWFRPGIALAELAAEAGYADQAHFTREFKTFTGSTPTVFRRLIETTRIVMNHDVASVQSDLP